MIEIYESQIVKTALWIKILDSSENFFHSDEIYEQIIALIYGWA